MNRIKLVVLSLLALVFARPTGFCTANTKKAEAPEPTAAPLSTEERLARLEAENLELKNQLSLPRVLDPAPADGTLAMLCKGAGVEIDDVRWRIQAGLEPDQAVQAALSQKQSDKAKKK
jgi:hypothetical protein